MQNKQAGVFQMNEFDKLHELFKDHRKMFAHFRSQHFIYFHDLASHPDYRDQLIGSILEYLSKWGKQKWIDEELIELLGRDISRISPPDFLLELNAKISTEIDNEIVKTAFMSWQETPVSEKVLHRLCTPE